MHYVNPSLPCFRIGASGCLAANAPHLELHEQLCKAGASRLQLSRERTLVMFELD